MHTTFAEQLAALGNHGVRVLPSEANFVLVLFEGALTGSAALAALADEGFIVRHLPGQGLPHDNTQPTQALVWCIAYAGIFPSFASS